MENFFSFLGISVLALFLVEAIWYLLQVVAMWKIFQKGGQPGWKSIIPWYREFTLFKITWKSSAAAWGYLICALPGYFINKSCAAQQITSGTTYQLGRILIFIGLVLQLIRSFKMAKAFGRSTAFGFGLWLLAPIFNLILGLGGDVYQGPQD